MFRSSPPSTGIAWTPCGASSAFGVKLETSSGGSRYPDPRQGPPPPRGAVPVPEVAEGSRDSAALAQGAAVPARTCALDGGAEDASTVGMSYKSDSTPEEREQYNTRRRAYLAATRREDPC